MKSLSHALRFVPINSKRMSKKMSYAPSISDIRFLENIQTYAKFLTILPNYDFKKEDFSVDSIYESVITYLIPVTFGILYLFSLICRVLYIYNQLLFSQQMLDYLCDLIGILIYILTICSSLNRNRQKWKKLFLTFVYIDCELKQKKIMKKFYFESYFSLFVVSHIVAFGSMLGILVILIQNFEVSKYIVILLVAVVFDFSLMIIIANICLSIRCRSQDANELLSLCIDSEKRVKIVDSSLCQHLDTILKVGNIYRAITEILTLLNDVFGWRILLLIARSVITSLTALNILFPFVRNMKDISFGKERISSFYSAVLLMCGTIYLNVASHATSVEVERLTGLCYSLHIKYPESSAERQELLILAKYVRYHTPTLSAGEFFNINRETLFSVVGTVTTCFIIITEVNGMYQAT